MEVDQLQLRLTESLKFHTVAFICLGIVYGRGAWNVFAVLFLAGTTHYSCKSSSNTVLPNVTSDNQLYNNNTLGVETWEESVVYSGECDVVIAIDNGTNITKPCMHGWLYKSEFHATIISEWDLVCVWAYLSELSTTVFLLGSMCGALLISPLSDRYGRRIVLLTSLLAQAVIGSCVALAQSYSVFTALRFVVGFFNMSIGLSSYVMVTELFPSVYCNLACCGLQIFWAVGIMLTSLFGFLIRDWRHLHLVTSLPNLLFSVFIWYLPESLPWLISQSKLGQAQEVVNRISNFNGIKKVDETLKVQYYIHPQSDTHTKQSDKAVQSLLSTASNPQDTSNGHSVQKCDRTSADNCVDSIGVITSDTVSYEQTHSLCKGNCSSLFVLCSNARLRFYSLILFYLFFVSSLSYFGISLSTPMLHGNQFLNLFLLGVVEIPAYVLCVIVGGRIGRKIPLCIFLFICGSMNIIAVLTSSLIVSDLKFISDICVIVSKFAITGVYTTIYLYSAEIFPTSIRNQAMGLSSFFENLGSIAAPFIVFFAKSIPELPMILFGVVSIVGGALVTLLPETKKRPLPVVIEDIE